MSQWQRIFFSNSMSSNTVTTNVQKFKQDCFYIKATASWMIRLTPTFLQHFYYRVLLIASKCIVTVIHI